MHWNLEKKPWKCTWISKINSKHEKYLKIQRKPSYIKKKLFSCVTKIHFKEKPEPEKIKSRILFQNEVLSFNHCEYQYLITG